MEGKKEKNNKAPEFKIEVRHFRVYLLNHWFLDDHLLVYYLKLLTLEYMKSKVG
jgi:hypothetical protein